MGRSVKEKIGRHLDEAFRECLDAAFRERWGVEVETAFDLLGSFRYVTLRKDGEDFTPEQHAWIGAYTEGWGRCRREVER